MYGLIIITVRELVVKKRGEKGWKKICAAAKVPHEYVKDQAYDDAIIYAIITEAAKKLQMEVPVIMEAVGVTFVEVAKNSEYHSFLKVAGNSLPEVMRNLNAMHALMRKHHFKEIESPNFHCISESTNRMRLFYAPAKPTRVGLAPLVVGILKALGVYFFVQNLKITAMKCTTMPNFTDEFIVEWSDSPAEHTMVERMRAAAIEDSAGDDVSISSSAAGGGDGPGYGMDWLQLAVAFPFHFVLNAHLDVIQVGPSLSKLASGLQPGVPFASIFEVTHPPSRGPVITFEEASSAWLYEAFTAKMKLKLKGATDGTEVTLALKGQIVSTASTLTFLGVPVLHSAVEASNLGLSLADFAIHDPHRDSLFTMMTAGKDRRDSVSVAKAAEDNKHLYREAAARNNKPGLFKRLFGSSPQAIPSSSSDGSVSGSPSMTKDLSGDNIHQPARYAKLPLNGNVHVPRMHSAPVPHPTQIGGSQTMPTSHSINVVHHVQQANGGSQVHGSASAAQMAQAAQIAHAAQMAGVTGCPFSHGASMIMQQPSINIVAPPPGRTLSHLREVISRDAWSRFPLTLRLLRTCAAKDDRAPMESVFEAVSVLCRQRFSHLLVCAIESEEKETEPLREDSVVSRLLAVYMRREGKAYLAALFAPLLEFSKISASNSAAARKVLELIDTHSQNPSPSSLPLDIRRVLSAVHQAILARNHSAAAAKQAIVAAFFLRFLNAALVNPGQVGITVPAEHLAREAPVVNGGGKEREKEKEKKEKKTEEKEEDTEKESVNEKPKESKEKKKEKKSEEKKSEEKDKAGDPQYSVIRIAKHLQAIANQPPEDLQAVMQRIVLWLTMQNDAREEVPLDSIGLTAASQATWDLTKQLHIIRDALQRHIKPLWTCSGTDAERVHEAMQGIFCTAIDNC